MKLPLTAHLPLQQQVPDIKPEPYHGSVSHAVRTNYPSAASQTRSYGAMPPHGMFGGAQKSLASPQRYSFYGANQMFPSQAMGLGSMRAESSSFMDGPSSSLMGGQAMPYAIVPAPYTSLFG